MMIVLMTDFGLAGPYTGQMKAVLARQAPGVPVISLFADAPAFAPEPSAYLLAAYAPAFPPPVVFVCVVDPGVGTDRAALVVEADGRLYTGPANGLFEPLVRRARGARAWRLSWRPESLSATFHGRDVFAPVAARLACGHFPPAEDAIDLDHPDLRRPDWPDDLARTVYVDHYGNVLTGLRASTLPAGARLRVGATTVSPGRTFADVPPGAALWYPNSNGLAEIAVNQGRAADLPGLAPGAPVTVLG